MDSFALMMLYMNLGIEHIITGYDHLLFVFALCIAVRKFAEFVKIITAFTAAHSITLFMASMGWIVITPSWIEAGIALTICFVALENIFVKEPKRRGIVTFGFGLIHGLGFASSIADIGFDRSHLLLSLLSFNLGIELGQIAVAVILFSMMMKLQSHQTTYRLFFQSASVLVFLIGIYWSVERVMSGLV